MKKKTIEQISLFALFSFMLVLVLSIFQPFFTIILWSVLLYVLISPLHRKSLARISPQKKLYELKRHLLAIGFSIGTIIVVVAPLVFIAIEVVQQLLTILSKLEFFIKTNPEFFSATDMGKFFNDFIGRVSLDFIHLDKINLKAQLINFIQKYNARIISMGSMVIRNIGGFIISVCFVLFSLYFFYLEGSYLAGIFVKAIPIDTGSMSKLTKKFVEITKHLFAGFFLVALYQAIISFILMTVFKVPSALLLSVLLLFCSFIPMLGAATVWLPVGISLVFTAGPLKGILFIFLAGIFISLMDNFLRPFFLKDRIKVHPLLIFFSILGGAKLFGFNGLLLGPMVLILFFTVLDILSSDESEIKTETNNLIE